MADILAKNTKANVDLKMRRTSENKTLNSRLYYSTVIVFFLFVLANCSKTENTIIGERNATSYSIADAIQGTWTGCQINMLSEKEFLERECERIGQIVIQDDMYHFYANPDISGASTHGALRFLFDAPTGKVNIEYYGEVEAVNLVGDYSDSDILALITFEAASGETGNTFYIRVGGSNKSLYFHSLISEVSTWGVWKEFDGED